MRFSFLSRVHICRVKYVITCVGLLGFAAIAEAKPFAIIGAFNTELDFIRSAISEPDTHCILGIRFYSGILEGKPVIISEAGVAKVNAAMTTTLLIEHFSPSAIIFSGIAGALSDSILPGDIIIGLETVHHDLVSISDKEVMNFGVINPVTGKRNPVFFPADEQLVSIARRASRDIKFEPMMTTMGSRTPRIVEGTIATGDAFIGSTREKADIRSRLNADAVEMEGAAVAQVCHQHDIPCIIIRSISDNADANAAVDFETFYRIAAQHSAMLVLKMIELID